MSEPKAATTGIARGRAFARAALLGNPSDGFGGKTLGLAFRELCAEVSLGVGRCEDRGARGLVEAALARAGEGSPRAGSAATVATEIPREVGLGGSSAIVIAALRAASRRRGREPSAAELAAMALAVERDDLGIEAGPQDRLIQAHGGLLYMDFAESEAGRCERLDPGLLPSVFVAWRTDAAQPSGAVHAELRRRHRSGDRETRAVLAEIASLALEGRRRLLEGRGSELGELMIENVALRGRVIELDPRHLRLVELARALGAGANYAGSGGAIVGLVPRGATIGELRAEYRREGFELSAATPAG